MGLLCHSSRAILRGQVSLRFVWRGIRLHESRRYPATSWMKFRPCLAYGIPLDYKAPPSSQGTAAGVFTARPGPGFISTHCGISYSLPVYHENMEHTGHTECVRRSRSRYPSQIPVQQARYNNIFQPRWRSGQPACPHWQVTVRFRFRFLSGEDSPCTTDLLSGL